MHNFSYTRAHDVAHAVRQLAADLSARIIAGGTNLVDLRKYNVEQPTHLIDITHLPLHMIEDTDDGGLRIGALVTNTAAAHDERVAQRYPLLAQAILAGVSPQLCNMEWSRGFYDNHLYWQTDKSPGRA